MPLAGHSLKGQWLERRSPNVPSVGDRLRILYDPPLPSGRRYGERLQVWAPGPPLIAWNADNFSDGIVFSWGDVE